MRDNLIIDMSRSTQAVFNGTSKKLIDGCYVTARPEGYPSIFYRIKATWLVWTGRADALVWPAGQ